METRKGPCKDQGKEISRQKEWPLQRLLVQQAWPVGGGVGLDEVMKAKLQAEKRKSINNIIPILDDLGVILGPIGGSPY